MDFLDRRQTHLRLVALDAQALDEFLHPVQFRGDRRIGEFRIVDSQQRSSGLDLCSRLESWHVQFPGHRRTHRYDLRIDVSLIGDNHRQRAPAQITHPRE